MAALVVVQGDPVRHDAHYDDGRYPDNEIADEKEGREGPVRVVRAMLRLTRAFAGYRFLGFAKCETDVSRELCIFTLAPRIDLGLYMSRR